jgi:hypothetical protein
MVKARDILITVCLLFLLLYSLIGDSNSKYWVFIYFVSIFTIIYKAIDNHRNKYLRLGIKSYSLVMIVYCFLNDILGYNIESFYTTVVFLIIFSTLSILCARNNVYKHGFFKY